jgi:hypothetical protein
LFTTSSSGAPADAEAIAAFHRIATLLIVSSLDLNPGAVAGVVGI